MIQAGDPTGQCANMLYTPGLSCTSGAPLVDPITAKGVFGTSNCIMMVDYVEQRCLQVLAEGVKAYMAANLKMRLTEACITLALAS